MTFTLPKPRMTVITDWRVRDEDALADVAPGEEYERVITPQKPVTLRRILCNLCLERLQVGPVDIPFEITADDGQIRYKPIWLHRVRDALARAGSGARGDDGVVVAAGQDVRILLRNETDAPAKPRAALLIEEEDS